MEYLYFSASGAAIHPRGPHSVAMATDMDIDMDLDVGLMEDEAAGPEMEILPEAEVAVSISLNLLHRQRRDTSLNIARAATASCNWTERNPLGRCSSALSTEGSPPRIG